ncbi:C40 family peptidase [Spongisporangium articulatum]|uniref:C40 family peptidase n=1 Tax=Spongisporangium articulatum TaxID=3362603 RepID=A0ABW8ARP5_9ACTN
MLLHAPKRLHLPLTATLTATLTTVLATALTTGALVLAGGSTASAATATAAATGTSPGTATTPSTVTDGVVDSSVSSSTVRAEKRRGYIRVTETGAATVTVARTATVTQKATKRLTSTVAGTGTGVGTASEQATATVSLTLARYGVDKAHATVRARKAARQAALDAATAQAGDEALDAARDAAAADATADATVNAVQRALANFSSLVLRTAASFEGTPYKWGANGPAAFDCSGYVRYVMRTAGVVDLPRTSADISAAVTRVAKKNRQVGDLIFFGTATGGVTHVGIYAGDDMIWHAPGTGRTVTKARIWTTRYTVGRVLTA